MSLKEMMVQQQSAMDIVEEKHNKEYIPLLTEAIKSVGGDPNVLHPSGGTDCTLKKNTSQARPRQKQTTDLRSSLKEMLATSPKSPTSAKNTYKPSPILCKYIPTQILPKNTSSYTSSNRASSMSQKGPNKSPSTPSSPMKSPVSCDMKRPKKSISDTPLPSFDTAVSTNDTIIMTGAHGVIRSGGQGSGLKAMIAEQRIEKMAVDAQLQHHEDLYGKYLGRGIAADSNESTSRAGNNSDTTLHRTTHTPTVPVSKYTPSPPRSPIAQPVSPKSVPQQSLSLSPSQSNLHPKPKCAIQEFNVGKANSPTSDLDTSITFLDSTQKPK